MPHISRTLLEKEKFGEINKQFYSIIKDLVIAGKTNVIFNELLTKTEKIMLAKRLAIITMLDRGESSYAIERILKVSSSTANKMSVKYEAGMYESLLLEVRRSKSFLTKIQKIIPPRVGRNRFSHFLKF